MRRSGNKAFTLVELVVVILILAILAGVAAPRVTDQVRLAAERAFVSHLLVCVAAIERCHAETGSYPADSNTGDFPEDLAGYLRRGSWSEHTPIGGRWDVEHNDNGVVSAVGASFQFGASYDVETLRSIDRTLDDGDLGAGALRWIAPKRLYYVLE